MPEHMLHKNMKCALSQLMVHTKNVRTYVTHVNMMFLIQDAVTYDNVICPNLCYPRKYDVFCPNLRYIRKWVMSEHMLHTNMRCIVSELLLHIEM